MTTDNYGSETTWALTNSAGTTVASGGPYANNTTINETFSLGDGDYTFTINDSYGDGICCSYGNGSYSLTDGSGTSIVSGGSFTTSEATNFCIAGSGGGGGGGGTIDDCNTVSNISASRRNWQYYDVTVPAGTAELTVTITGGSGDADLYVRQGSANPTTSNYDCRPYKNGNEETCTFDNPAAGDWSIGIRAYSAFSGVTMTVCNNGVPTRINREGANPIVDAGTEFVAAVGVYPNPVSSTLNFDMSVSPMAGSDVVIYTISGTEALRVSADNLRDGIDVSGLQNGMYLISIQDEKNNAFTQRFVKN